MSGYIEEGTTPPEQLSQRITELNESLQRALNQIQELDDQLRQVNQRIVDDTDEIRRELRYDVSECERRIGNVEDDVRRLNR